MTNNLLIYAKHYHSLGLNITCITNYLTEFNFNKKTLTKTSYKDYKNLENERQSINELQSLDWENATGLGLVIGYNNLRVIDIDGCSNESILEEILDVLELPKYYDWVVKSGSHNGFHIIFYCEKDFIAQRGWNTKNAKIEALSSNLEYRDVFEKMEFLWEHHLTLPPSIHKSTLNYEFLNDTFPKNEPQKVNFQKIKKVIDKFIDKREVLFPSSQGVAKEFEPIHTQTNFENLNLRKLKERGIRGSFYLAVDIETDGLPNDLSLHYSELDNWPNIIQIAWVVMDEKGRIIKKNSDVILRDNYKKIDILNIEYDNINKVGRPLKDVLKSFLIDVKEVSCLIAHNADFDLKTIQAEILRSNLKNEIENVFRQVCTMKSSIDFCNIQNSFGNKYPTLNELYGKLFENNILGSHNAESDVLATAKCFWKLKTLKIIR